MKKIGIFVDVQNIYYTTRDAFGRSFDYRKFWQHINQQGNIVIANAYAIQRSEQSDVNDSQIKFQDALRHIGFSVKLKPFIQRADGSAKGDWDVGITIDILKACANLELDNLILLSGDGDFALLLNTIKQDFNVESIVYGVTKLTAMSLIDSADSFVEINQELLINKS